MIRDLHPASRKEHLIFFDPEAIPPDTEVDPDLEEQDPALPPQEAIRKLAAAGDALIIKIPVEDCEASVRVHIGEEPSEDIRRRGKCRLDGAALKVPSGILKADGLEFLTRPGEERIHSAAEFIEIEPGLYEIELWDLFRWKVRNAEAFVKSQTSRLDRVVGRMITIYTWIGILLVPVNIFLAPLAIMITSDRAGWRSALALLGLILAFDALVLAGYWALEKARDRKTVLTRVQGLRREFESQHPDIALVLRRKQSIEHLGRPAMVVLRWG